MERRSVAGEIVVDFLYAIAIGVNVYLVMDTMTDGALTRSVIARMEKLKERLEAMNEARKSWRKDVGTVLFEATMIVEDQ